MATRRKSQTSRTKARHRKQKPDTTEMAEANPADAAALDAGEFLNMITGAWVSQITRAVAELHILDHLAETAEDIARIESSDPRTAFRLMRAAQGIARTWLAHFRGSAERGRRRGRNCPADQLDRGPRDRRRGMAGRHRDRTSCVGREGTQNGCQSRAVRRPNDAEHHRLTHRSAGWRRSERVSAPPNTVHRRRSSTSRRSRRMTTTSTTGITTTIDTSKAKHPGSQGRGCAFSRMLLHRRPLRHARSHPRVRRTEIRSLDADFPIIVPFTTVAAAPIRARVNDSSHAGTPPSGSAAGSGRTLAPPR